MSCQSWFGARYWMLGSGTLERPRGMVWGGRREEGSGWGTQVYLWRIHFDIWQNQYNIVKLNKIKLKNNKIKDVQLKKKKRICLPEQETLRDEGLIPGSRRFPAEGNGNPLQYSCLENPIDRGAWWATVHRVAKNQTQLKWSCMYHGHDLQNLKNQVSLWNTLKSWA